MRILLTGSKGQLAQCFRDRLPDKWEVISTDSASLDITDATAVFNMVQNFQPDAIVNAANSQLLGCFVPHHFCIDNEIHTMAGVELREKCFAIMQAQGVEEPAGRAKITPGYNLPAKYVLHTVGPIVNGPLTKSHRHLLASCYRACLSLAAEYECRTVAFCCISTGVFMFPNQPAAEIAVETVRQYYEKTGSQMKVIFNVFKDEDFLIYHRLLS